MISITFYPVEINTWGGDTCLYFFVEKSNMFDIINAIDLIKIKHYSMHNKRMEQDEISKRVQDKHIRNRVYDVDRSSYDPWMVNFKTIIDKRKKFLWKP
jgi:hypothetical protein